MNLSRRAALSVLLWPTLVLAHSGASPDSDAYACAPGTLCRTVSCVPAKKPAQGECDKRLEKYAHCARSIEYKEEPQANLAYTHGQMKVVHDYQDSIGQRHSSDVTFVFRGVGLGESKQLVSERMDNVRIDRLILEVPAKVARGERAAPATKSKWSAKLYLIAPTLRGEVAMQEMPLACESTEAPAAAATH